MANNKNKTCINKYHYKKNPNCQNRCLLRLHMILFVCVYLINARVYCFGNLELTQHKKDKHKRLSSAYVQDSVLSVLIRINYN